MPKKMRLLKRSPSAAQAALVSTGAACFVLALAIALPLVIASGAHAASAQDWGASGWMDNSAGQSRQPTFGRQWWQTDVSESGQQAPTSQSPATNCRSVAERANGIRQGLGRDLDDYARCLQAGSKAPDDCARPFDRVKTGQYEYERAVREFGDRCR